jgi:ERCC4-type nuclease
VQSKLALLTMHFPRLRVMVGCGRVRAFAARLSTICVQITRSSRDSANLFRLLKRNQPDAELSKVAASAADSTLANESEDLVRALPGITTRNLPRVLADVQTVRARARARVCVCVLFMAQHR